MSKPPEWALREAETVWSTATRSDVPITWAIALALDAARRRGIEEATQVIEPYLSPRMGIARARDPSALWAEIIAKIRALVSKEPT